MQIKYTLQGSRRVLLVNSVRIVLEKGDNELSITKSVFDKIKTDLDRYVSTGMLQYEAIEDAPDNRNQDEQKTLKQNLLKQAKELGLSIANTMSVEVLQGIIGKHLEQVKQNEAQVLGNENVNPQNSNLPLHNDNTGNNQANS